MKNNLENIISWAKRRGFIFRGSEIYGGLSGVYDFGPYGLTLKNNIKKLWWQNFVLGRDDIVGLESAILMNRSVWQASGHEKDFIDDLVECRKCHLRFKADDLPDDKCASGGDHQFTPPRQFNPMFKTNIGVIEEPDSLTYLRPETAQGMFVDFSYILAVCRQRIPFGIAQIGKSFRNEINTKDFLFRVREFELAEIEYFVSPGEDEKSFDKWLESWQKFIKSLGIKKQNLRAYEHPKNSLSHYSKKTVDWQYQFPFGWKELAGVANRTDYDLKSHQKHSGKDSQYFDQDSGKKYWPYVIEPTLGIERLMLAIISEAFEEVAPRTKTTESTKEKEIVLHFRPEVAPIKIAILPLVKKLSQEARQIYTDLKSCWPEIEYDETGSIGRRYRRQDEIGTPYCLTIDFDTLKDKKVTIRDRDTMKQDRIPISDIKNYFFEKLNS